MSHLIESFVTFVFCCFVFHLVQSKTYHTEEHISVSEKITHLWYCRCGSGSSGAFGNGAAPKESSITPTEIGGRAVAVTKVCLKRQKRINNNNTFN